MSNIKKIFTKTKVPYIIVAIVLLIVMIALGFKANHLNNTINAELINDHARIHRSINTNQNRIFKYRAQLSALSDQHSSYLLRKMMSQVLSAEMNNQNSNKKVKLHNLRKNPQYMSMTRTDMKINDRDNMHIEHLQHVISNEENTLPNKKPHYLTNNMFSPQLSSNSGGTMQERNNFHKMVTYGTSIGILFVIDAVILLYKILKKK